MRGFYHRNTESKGIFDRFLCCRTISCLVYSRFQSPRFDLYFCVNQCHHQTQSLRVKVFFSQITSICESLKKAARLYDQSSIAFSIVSETDATNQNLDDRDPSFMYTQLFKEIIQEIPFDKQAIKDLTNYWREQLALSSSYLEKANEFEQEYHQHLPIWWYTYETLLYEIRNRALRTLGIGAIMKMGVFLKDLHGHIARLYFEQSAQFSQKRFTIYRGQRIPIGDFEKLRKSKGGLMFFNNLLSTTTDEGISLFRAESNQENSDLIGIHFEIIVDSSVSSISFALLDTVSCYGVQESEILFSMYTIFRAGDIEPISRNERHLKVNLTLTADNGELLAVLTQRMRKDISIAGEGWDSLERLLIVSRQFDKAEKLYILILHQTFEYQKESLYYNILGTVKQRL